MKYTGIFKRIFINYITLAVLFGTVSAFFGYFIINNIFLNKIDYSTNLVVFDKNLKRMKAEFKVAVADTDKKRSKGLMFVKNMQDDNGMLFVFADLKTVSFWMKNTYISLDLLFVDENMKVISITEKAAPLSENLISSVKPIKYVVELNAGIVSDYGIVIGDIIKVDNISNAE